MSNENSCFEAPLVNDEDPLIRGVCDFLISMGFEARYENGIFHQIIIQHRPGISIINFMDDCLRIDGSMITPSAMAKIGFSDPQMFEKLVEALTPFPGRKSRA